MGCGTSTGVHNVYSTGASRKYEFHTHHTRQLTNHRPPTHYLYAGARCRNQPEPPDCQPDASDNKTESSQRLMKYLPDNDAADVRNNVLDAAQNGDCYKMKRLLEYIRRQTQTIEIILPRVIYVATRNQDVEMLRLIIKYVTKYSARNIYFANIEQFTACINECIMHNNSIIFQLLLDIKLDTKNDGYSERLSATHDNEKIFAQILHHAIQHHCSTDILIAADKAWMESYRTQYPLYNDFQNISKFYKAYFTNSAEEMDGKQILYMALYFGIKRHVIEILSQSEESVSLQPRNDLDLRIICMAQKFPDAAKNMHVTSMDDVSRKEVESFAQWYRDVAVTSKCRAHSDSPLSDKDTVKLMRQLFERLEFCTEQVEFSEVCDAISDVLHIFAHHVTKRDAMVAFKPVLTNQSTELKASFYPDHFKVLFVLTTLGESFNIHGDLESGFTMKFKPEQARESLREILCGDCLSMRKLNSRLCSTVSDVMTLVRRDITDARLRIEESETVCEKHAIGCLYITWSGQVYKDLKIKINIAAAFEINESAIQMPRHAYLHGRQDLYITAPLPEPLSSTDGDVFTVDFSPIESYIITSLPCHIKQGYIIAKIMRNATLIATDMSHNALADDDIDLVTSPMIHSAVLYKTNRLSEVDVTCGSAILWGIKIYRKLQRFLTDGYFPQFFCDKLRSRAPGVTCLFYCDNKRRADSLQSCLCCRRRNVILEITDRIIYLLKIYHKHN